MKNYVKTAALAVLFVFGAQLAQADDHGQFGRHNGGYNSHRGHSSHYANQNNFGQRSHSSYYNNYNNLNRQGGLSFGIGVQSSYNYGGGHVHHNVNPSFNPGRGHYDWHNTSHYHYVPSQIVPHGNHYDVQPGYYSLHQTGHYDLHHR